MKKILKDYTSKTKKKKRDWKKKKKQSLALSKIYRKISEDYGYKDYFRKFIRVKDCGNWLEFSSCPEGHEKKLKNANFCRDRLCPMCQWRKSLKLAHQIKEICHYAVIENDDIDFLFLTLSAKNVDYNNLDDEITKYMKSFRKLIRRKEVKNILEGYFKSLEITYNKNPNGNNKDLKYHPHLHILLVVNSNYFGRNYITQERWTELWKKSMKLDYKPIVDIRKVKKVKNRNNEVNEFKIWKTAAELGKYSVKATEYLQEDIEESKEVVFTLANALKYRRLTSYGGILKDLYKKLQMQDVDDENSDLVNVEEKEELKECKCSVCNSDLVDELYKWNFGFNNYVKTKNIISKTS